jgi:hypothetical protein
MSHEDKTINEITHKTVFHCDVCQNPDHDGPQIIDHYEWEETAFRTCVVCHKDFCQVCYEANHKHYNYHIEHVLVSDKNSFVCDICMSIINTIQKMQDAINSIDKNNVQITQLQTETWAHYRTIKDELSKF